MGYPLWSVLVLAAVAAFGLASCDSSAPHRASRPTKQSLVEFVLTDTALEYPRTTIPGGIYTLTFRDGRTRRPKDEHVYLYFGVSGGPEMELGSVPLGTTQKFELSANLGAWVVINPSADRETRWQQGFDYVRPDIVPSAENPTIAT
jgi:hypothetical protein